MYVQLVRVLSPFWCAHQVSHTAGSGILAYVRQPTAAWVSAAVHVACGGVGGTNSGGGGGASSDAAWWLDQWVLGAPYQQRR